MKGLLISCSCCCLPKLAPLCVFHATVRRQGHHPGDRPAQRPGPGPAQAHPDLLHGGAAVPPRAGVPAVSVRRGAWAHRAGPAAQPVRNTGEEEGMGKVWQADVSYNSETGFSKRETHYFQIKYINRSIWSYNWFLLDQDFL